MIIAETPIPEPGSDVCIDIDGDGLGEASGALCQVVPTDTSGELNPDVACGASTGRFNSARDLLVLHYDFGRDRDESHAATANKALVDIFNIPQLWVVSGTNSLWQNRYLPGADALMNQVYGDGRWTRANILDTASFNAAAAASTNRWLQTLNNGGEIWVAEGGPGDFTRRVLQAVKNSVSDCVAMTKIHIVQHSATNELNTGRDVDESRNNDLAFIQANTDYIKIDDGNRTNSTADLHANDNREADNRDFINQALSSRWSSEWQAAFEFLAPGIDVRSGKLDFSDTVELLHILNVPLSDVADWDDFADRFF